MNLTNAVGWALLQSLWQGAVVAIGLRVLLLICRRSSANTRYALSVAALAALPMVFVASVLQVSRRADSDSRQSSEAIRSAVDSKLGGGAESLVVPRAALSIASHAPVMPTRASAVHVTVDASDESLSPSAISSSGSAQSPEADQRATGSHPALRAIAIAWYVGVILLAFRMLAGWRVAHRMTGRDGEPIPESWKTAACGFARRLDVRRAVRISLTDAVSNPAVIGWLKPVIMVPLAIVSSLTPPQVELLLAHELAHVRRHDYLVNLIQCVIESLFFYHPAIWWISGRIREERENCCDDLVVSLSGDPLDYAEALLMMERLRSDRLPAPAIAATGGALVTRVRRLLGASHEAERLPRWRAGVVVATCAATVLLGTQWSAQLRGVDGPRVANQTAISCQSQPQSEGVMPQFVRSMWWPILSSAAGTMVAGPSAPAPLVAQETASQTRDSAGIRIVENRHPAWRPGEEWVLDTVPLMTISDSGEPARFSWKLWVGLARDGRIVINDNTTDIAVYDSAGRLQRRFGRRADGLGTFPRDPGLAALRGDTVVVWDESDRRLSWFALNGKLVREEIIDGEQFPEAIRADGMVLTITDVRGPGGSSGPAGVQDRLGRVTAVGPDARLLDFGVQNIRRSHVRYYGRAEPSKNETSFVSDGSTEFGLFNRVFLFTTGPIALTTANWEGWEVRQYDGQGRLSRIIRRALTPRHPLPEALFNNYRSVIPEGEIPDSLPLIQSWASNTLIRDAEGNLWVGRQRVPPHPGGIWPPEDYDVFDPNGRWLGTVNIPARFGSVLAIGKGYILLGAHDDLDFTTIRAFRLGPKN